MDFWIIINSLIKFLRRYN